MKGTIFNHTENTTNESEHFLLQNPHMLLVNLNGSIFAKQGAMAAYQGEMDFKFHGGGVGRFFKKLVTGEGLPLMEVSGKGDLFLADNGSEVYVVNLENEPLSVNGSNLLAFESSLEWDINLIRTGAIGLVAGGLFNVTLTGTGATAITSWGTPVVLKIDQPTMVDINCVIAWSAGLQTDIVSTLKAGALIGRGSGEAFQMRLSGEGIVIVQPGEGPASLIASATR